MGTTASITITGGRRKTTKVRERRGFRRNRAAAILRRMWWRIRWAVCRNPWRLSLRKDLRIIAPKCRAGALIYYYGYSEPETASFVLEYLKPGMVFWDVGAHIGEYSLLASSLVGPAGSVESFEPQSGIFDFLVENIRENGCSNIHAREIAISDSDANRRLIRDKEAISRTGDLVACRSVITTTLDNVNQDTDLTPHLIKIDVEGTEMLVLQGATDLLHLPPATAPVWIIGYHPANCARFGYYASDLLWYFDQHGYTCHWLAGEGRGNFVASKRDIL